MVIVGIVGGHEIVTAWCAAQIRKFLVGELSSQQSFGVPASQLSVERPAAETTTDDSVFDIGGTGSSQQSFAVGDTIRYVPADRKHERDSMREGVIAEIRPLDTYPIILENGERYGFDGWRVCGPPSPPPPSPPPLFSLAVVQSASGGQD